MQLTLAASKHAVVCIMLMGGGLFLLSVSNVIFLSKTTTSAHNPLHLMNIIWSVPKNPSGIP